MSKSEKRKVAVLTPAELPVGCVVLALDSSRLTDPWLIRHESGTNVRFTGGCGALRLTADLDSVVMEVEAVRCAEIRTAPADHFHCPASVDRGDSRRSTILPFDCCGALTRIPKIAESELSELIAAYPCAVPVQPP